jgi:hypothetical protein
MLVRLKLGFRSTAGGVHRYEINDNLVPPEASIILHHCKVTNQDIIHELQGKMAWEISEFFWTMVRVSKHWIS